MLHLTIILALAATSCCSAFQVQVPDSVLAYLAANPAAPGRNLYFPCNDVSAGHMLDLDLRRFNGRWFQVNAAFTVSDKIDPADVQQRISTEIGCVKGQFNTLNPSGQIDIAADIITRQPVPANATLPPNAKWINANDIQFTSGAVFERPGDNGLWFLNTSIDNNDTLLQDFLVVSTDYISYAILYTCQDVPVPRTADTKREQQWSIILRQPRNLKPEELTAMTKLALENGIDDADNLYTYPTDRCRSPPPTTTTTTPTTTTSTTTTTPTTTIPTTTTTTTTTSPSTSTATAGPELPTNFYQSFVRKVRNFRPF